MAQKILITGGTGFIGSHLTPVLKEMGHEVVHLSHRTPMGDEGVPTYHWDHEQGVMDEKALEGLDAVIHLAGANLNKRWTTSYKEQIERSRVEGSRFLIQQLKELETPPKVFISASAIGYYGSKTSDHIFTEEDPPADDFVGNVVRKWEKEVDAAGEFARVVKLRSGLVLDKDEGVLPQLVLPVKFGVGAPLGSGKQYMPWIHLLDICRAYLFALEKEGMEGAYNVAAPEHVTNEGMIHSIAKVLNRPVFLPGIPGGLMKMAMGERGEMALEGSRVSPEKLQNEGFQFKYPKLMEALEAIFRPLQQEEKEA